MSVYLVCDQHGRRPARDLHLRRCLICQPLRRGPTPKVPPSEHRAIQDRIQDGETLRAVATTYGVTPQRIHEIARARFPGWDTRGKRVRGTHRGTHP